AVAGLALDLQVETLPACRGRAMGKHDDRLALGLALHLLPDVDLDAVIPDTVLRSGDPGRCRAGKNRHLKDHPEPHPCCTDSHFLPPSAAADERSLTTGLTRRGGYRIAGWTGPVSMLLSRRSPIRSPSLGLEDPDRDRGSPGSFRLGMSPQPWLLIPPTTGSVGSGLTKR